MAPAPPPPHVPAPHAPPPGLTLARWLYVDDRRAHQVHAGLRGGTEFVVRESAFANDDPDEVADWARRVAEPWEAQFYLLELEKRLALLGRYWRFDAAQPDVGWTAVRGADPFEGLDLRPVQGAPFEGRVAFHHYHQTGAQDVVLATLAQPTPRGPRHLLATLTLAFPDAEGGDLQLLHPRLPDAPARSLLAREHLALRAGGHAKLVDAADFARAHGADAARARDEAYRAALQRLSEGAWGRARRGREPPVDAVYTDYATALADPRLMALHARFLAPGEEETLLAAGEPAIRRFIQRQRQACEARDQHLLTLLQASLLARDGLRAHAAVDPEVAALVRRFSHYL